MTYPNELKHNLES